MRTRMMLAVAAMMFTSAVHAQNKVESIAIGSDIPAATIEMRSVDGKDITLKSSATSRGLLVMFSCNTCPYVIKSQARTLEMMKLAKERGLGVVIVNSNEAKRGDDDSYDAMKKYAKSQGYTASYVVDEKSKVADAFGANRTPEVFLFDKAGKLVYKGGMEDNPQDPANSKDVFLRDAINNLVTGKEIAPNSTKSIGCTIKRAS